MLRYLVALGTTLVLECPTAVLGYRSLVGVPRSFLAALAVNLATHGVLWTVWPFLGGAYATRAAISESVVVIVEAACYRFLLGGTARRAFAVSLIANALSTAAGLLEYLVAR
jgi:hypothetical protein